MADIGLETLTAPISDQDPCGPDLDDLEDGPYTTFMLTTTTDLPDEYFVADHKGDRVPCNLESHYQGMDLGLKIKAAAPLVERTHDLRLLYLLAKLHALNKSLSEFHTVVEAMAVLLETQWDAVHPQGDDELRRNALERLDEPMVVTALNNVPLLRSKRHGIMTWQAYLVIARAGGRQDPDFSAIDRLLQDETRADQSALVAVRSTMDQLHLALRRIVETCATHFPPGSPVLQGLPAAVSAQCAMLHRICPVPGASPPAAEAPAAPNRLMQFGLDMLQASVGSAPPPAPSPAAMVSTEDAAEALAAATGYFTETEPSSPAILLLKRAQALVGKSFLEAIEALLPEHVSKAQVNIGSAAIFNLPLTQLAEKETESDGEDASSGRDRDDDDEPKRRPASTHPRVETRGDALAILQEVAHFYRQAEPSSPIPLLTDRACALVGRDFMSLISTMLPEDLLNPE